MESSTLPALKAKQKQFTDDIQTFQTLIANLEAHRLKLAAKIEKEKAKKELRLNEKAGMAQEEARLRQLRDNQEITPEDAEAISNARKELSAKIHAVEARKNEVEQRAFKQEVALAKELDKAQGGVRAYNAEAERLHLLPAESRIAGGVDFEIRVSPYASQRGQSLVLNDIQQTLIPSIAALQEHLTDTVHSTGSQRLAHESENARITDLVAAATAQATAAEQAFTKEEEALSGAKLQGELEQDGWDAALEQLQDEAMAIRYAISGSQGEEKKMKAEFEEQLRALDEELQKEREQYEEFANEFSAMITSHFETADECVSEYRATVEAAGGVVGL